MLTLELADRITTNALAEGEKKGFAPLCVAVLDAGGHLLALKRDERSSIGRPEIAIGKASGCLDLGVGGRTLATMSSQRPVFFSALNALFPWGIFPVPGGILVRDSNGIIIGAVGVTGDVSENDEACGLRAIEAVGLTPDSGD